MDIRIRPVLGILVVACALGLSAGGVASAALPIDLIVENPNSTAWNGLPVTSGVPLLRGVVTDVSQLALEDGAGNPVPAQFIPIVEYTDGTPRWVLVDFQPTVGATSSASYRIVAGTAAPHPTPLQIYEDGSSITVDTGAAVFVINKINFNLFDSVTVGGIPVVSSSQDSGIVVTKASDSSMWRSYFGNATFSIEDAGPLHAVVKVVGDHRRFVGDSSHLLEYTCRIHFYAGQSFVRVFYTLENAKRAIHRGNFWDAGQGGYEDFRDASLQLHTNLAGSIDYLAQGEQTAPPMSGTVQGPTYLFQYSSGGDNWDHDHHMDRNYVRYHQYPGAFRGWRLMRNGSQVAAGNRAIGWMAFDDGTRGIAVGMRHFWQNCPSAVEIDGADVYIRPFPKYWTSDHGFEFEGGQHKTTECLLYFYADPAGVEEVMTGLNNPLFARCTPQHYADTYAFEYMGQYNPADHPKLEQYCNAVVTPVFNRSVITQWERYDEYGWRDFGDLVADHEHGSFGSSWWSSNGISHYGNEYFASEGTIIQFARRGDLRYLESAVAQARHVFDIHQYHTTDVASEPAYAGGHFAHTTHGIPALRARHRVYPGEGDWDFLPELDQTLFPGCPDDIWDITYDSGGPGDPGHLNPAYYYYFLTGDRECRDAILTYADWAVRRGPFTNVRNRSSGNVLICLLYAYQLTHDPVYMSHIMSTIAGNDYVGGSTGWSMSWHVDGLARFILWKRLNGEFDAAYRAAVNSAINYSNGYLSNFSPSPSYWRYHDLDALALLYLSLPESHPNRAALLAKADAEKPLCESAIPSWIQAKNLSVLLNSGHPYMCIKEGRTAPPIPGDVDRDGDVDVFDVISIVNAFGTRPGDPNWDGRADFDDNGQIDIFDVISLVNYFGTVA